MKKRHGNFWICPFLRAFRKCPTYVSGKSIYHIYIAIWSLFPICWFACDPIQNRCVFSTWEFRLLFTHCKQSRIQCMRAVWNCPPDLLVNSHLPFSTWALWLNVWCFGFIQKWICTKDNHSDSVTIIVTFEIVL